MTPSEQRTAAKLFQSRRAGLADPDEAADTVVLDLLRIVGRDQAGNFLSPRPLTLKEKELHRLGNLGQEIRGEIMTAADAATLEQQRLAKVRSEAQTRARKAEAEARRLTAEAARMRESSA